MFVSEKSPGEIPFTKQAPLAPPPITKLSQAIRVGALTVPEDKSWNGCALGTAAKACGFDGGNNGIGIINFLSKRFNISHFDLEDISNEHYRTSLCSSFDLHSPREEIAAKLEALDL